MLQRIQTLFMTLAVIVLITSFFTEIAQFSNNSNIVNFSLLSIDSPSSEIILPEVPFNTYAKFLVALILLVTSVNIFLFKNRKLQLKIAYGSYALFLILLVFLLMTPEKIMKQLPEEGWEVSYKIGYYLPIAATFLLILATRSIKKDEELVKSTDRLR